MDGSSKQDNSIYDTEATGICIIIANYVDNAKNSLPGYGQDVEEIRKTFSNSKKFDFDLVEAVEGEDSNQPTIPLLNLSKAKFEEVIELLQNKIKNRQGEGQYDKFVMFVLSHGSEEGVLMYPEDGKDEGEYVSIEYIIESFTHQNVPCLKGKPKCFFFQTCRGSEETLAASLPSSATDDWELQEEEPIRHPEITKANILAAYATLPGTRAYVDSHSGSFFIRDLCKTLKNQDAATDIISVLTSVNGKMSKKEIPVCFPCDQNNKIMLKQKQGTVEVRMIGAILDEQNGRWMLIPIHSVKSGYAISDLPQDYSFKGKIIFIQTNMIIWDESKGKMPGDQLAKFLTRPDFEIVGTLHSEINHGWQEHGKIEMVNRLTVNGRAPTHGVTMKQIDVMAQVGEKIVHPRDIALQIGELHLKGVKYYDGIFKLQNKHLVLRCEVYQMAVFYSTLTKQLVLSRGVDQLRKGSIHLEEIMVRQRLMSENEVLEAENRDLKQQCKEATSSIHILTRHLSSLSITQPEGTEASQKDADQTKEDASPPLTYMYPVDFQPAGVKKQEKQQEHSESADLCVGSSHFQPEPDQDPQ